MKTKMNNTVTTIASVMLVTALLGAILSCGAAVAMGLPQDPAIFAGVVETSQQALALAGAKALFSSDGSTSAFGIPQGVRGNVNAGQGLYDISCATCHGDGSKLRGVSYHTFQRRLKTGAMEGLPLSEQEAADIVAWLNRTSTQPATAETILANAGGGSAR
jgi:hypothetical protein